MNQAGKNEDVRENLSAGIDGELSGEQLRFLLRRLEHDDSARQAWTNYHLIRDGLRQQMVELADAGFSTRVLRALERELPMAASKPSHWLRWSAGGVIAASVAAAALMVTQPVADSGRDVAAVSQSGPAIASVTPVARPTAPASVPQWLSGNSAGLLSQQASATLGAPFGQSQPGYARGLSDYRPLHRYRTLDNNDGSYLLLLDPAQTGVGPARAATAAQ